MAMPAAAALAAAILLASAAGLAAAAAALAERGPEEPICWEEGTLFTFDVCCREYTEKVRGNPNCWVKGFTFEICCRPEFPRRVRRGFEMLERGAYWEASNYFMVLTNNYLTAAAAEPDDFNQAWLGFQKSAKEVIRALDKAPHSLSYFEVLFRGLGLDCQPGLPGALPADGHLPDSEGPDPYSEWARCCWSYGLFGSKPCNLIFEMMAHALGSGRHQSLPERDAYYANMSELWAFHHFTPSMILSTDIDPSLKPLAMAESTDAELAAALSAVPEPSLGIVWAEHVTFESPKFIWGVYFLTLLFSTMRKAGAGGAVDFIELGAGFGSLPRLLATAKARLLGAQPPVGVRSYTVFDVRSVIDLQRWYLNKTVGDLIRQWDWGDEQPDEAGLRAARSFNDSRAGGGPGAARALWRKAEQGQEGAASADAPLRVDFVDTDMRDLFCHLYAEAHSEEMSAAPEPGKPRPARVLVAVNSWHEFTMPDFLWYYNAFVAAPVWRTGVDWILYVSNRAWPQNDAKEALLLEPRPHFRFEVRYEDCSAATCTRILQRVQ